MAFAANVALRYLKSSRENRYFSWITLLSMIGIAIGVAALIVVLSVINGFKFELRNRFLQANAHIMAYRYPVGMVNPAKWSAEIQKDFKGIVRGASPFVHAETMAKNGAIMQGILVRGIAPSLRENVQSLRHLIKPPEALDELQTEIDNAQAGKPAPEVPAVILGTGVLGALNVKIGDFIYIIAPTENQFSDMKRFRVAGVYNSGLKHYDFRLVAMSLSEAQVFFRMGEAVTGLEIGLYDADKSPEVARAMEDKYSLSFREWQSYNKHLFDAMENERTVIGLIVAIVMIVAGFNILTTVFVSVSQKQRDISILKALGARNRQIMSLFLFQSLSIGIVGSLVGASLAWIIAYILTNYPFFSLPEPYFLTSLPVHQSVETYLGVTGAAIIVCILAGLYPAIIASRVVPTEGIKGTGQSM